MHPPQGVGAIPDQVLQQGERRRVLAFEEETLRGLTPPGVGIGQQGHELGGLRLAQGRLGALLEAVGDQVVEPPAVLPARQVEVLLDRLGDRGRVFDRLAIHVQDQERPVGGVGEVDGPEPVVRRGQEFDLLIGPRREELRAVLREGLAMDEVAPHVADEGVAAVLGGVGGPPIDRHAGGGGEEAGGDQLGRREPLGIRGIGRTLAGPDDPPGLGRADPVDRRGGPFGRDVGEHRRGRERRVPLQVAGGEEDLADMVAVVAGEAVSPVVEAVAELTAARGRLEARAVGLEAEVAATDRDGLVVRPRRVADVAAVAPRDAVNPAVEAPLEAVHERLDVLGPEAGEDDLLLVGHPVAVGVAGVQDVRGHRDEDPSVVGQHARRPRQVVDEDRAPLVDAVAVAVFEPADVAGGRVLGVRISAHLGRVDPAVGVVDDAHRVGHDRLRGHRLEAEPLVQAERLQGGIRFEGLDPGQFLGQVVFLAASGSPSQAGPEEQDEQREAMRHGEILHFG